MKTKKRFKLWDIENQVSKFSTDVLPECVEEIKKIDSLLWNEFFIEDTIDDIEINAEEFMEAWERGERPEDLQMF